MKLLVITLVLASLGLPESTVAQTSDASVGSSQTKETPVVLNDVQKAAVIDAALDAKSRQKTPKDFSPTLGSTAPKSVFVHAFKPEVSQRHPLLKEYSYAFLDREIVLLGPTRKAVAVITLPEQLVDNEQPHQGAAEASTNAKGDGGDPTTSVPSHTSPESIK